MGLVLIVRRLRRVQRRLDQLTQGADGRSLEAVLATHLEKSVWVAGEVSQLSARTARLESNARHAFQRIGLIRFNPFEDTGGNQSFALALLDADEHGVIISSLHSRNGTRIYAKALTEGRSDGALSDEETQALDLARSATMGRASVVERSGQGATAARR